MPASVAKRKGGLLGALAVGVLVAVSALGFAAPAQAHNYIVTSTPEAGSTLTELPEQFSITTNAPLLDILKDGSGFAMQIVDFEGKYYGDGCVTVEGSSLYTAAALGAAGDYRLLWQVVSEDGHSVSDEIPFAWDPDDPAQATEGVAAPPTCPGSEAAAPPAAPPTDSAAPGNADLSDVLWIGGAIVAVLVAAGVTFLLLTRKTKTQE